jgi:hypothetical protein
MARAAVKAKQQQAKAKAQPAKPRGRRRHSGGGNPNQDLFFVRLRRHQKWVYAVLAVVFGLSFVLVGVGSGNGGGLTQLYNNLFGGSGGSSVSKAQDEIKTNPAKGYRDLATAYEQQGHPALAIAALTNYLAIQKTDAPSWGELGGLQLSQGTKYANQLQSAQVAAQQADPSAPFLPSGQLGAAVGTNPTYQGATQTASARTSILYQRATGAFTEAVNSYQRASNLHPRNTVYLQELAQAAINARNAPVAVRALQSYLKLPTATQKKRIEQEIKSLQAQIKTPTTGTPSVSTGSGG